MRDKNEWPAWWNEEWDLLEDVLPAGSWEGKPCVCVGGGPSLKGFDFGRIKGMRSIGINRAFEFFDPTIMLWMDSNFHRWLLSGEFGKEAIEKFNRLPSYKVWILSYRLTVEEGVYVLPVENDYVYARNNFSTDLSKGVCHANNTGYAALNLAFLLGASPIYLLGYDMDAPSAEGSHFHSGYPRQHGPDIFRSFAKMFKKAEKAIGDKAEVVNLNPRSLMYSFTKKNVDEVFPCA